jgi:hypothetical protein
MMKIDQSTVLHAIFMMKIRSSRGGDTPVEAQFPSTMWFPLFFVFQR